MKYITVMIIILVLLPFIGRGSPSPWQRTSCTITVTVRTEGTFIGGAYEYICSVFTEIVFGKIFWDYRGLPFNLGGRINLLYCFFWGIAAVVRLKKLYPLFSNLIERIPMRTGKIGTWCLVAFMCVDISVSTLALARCNGRAHHRKAANGIERLLDERFPDNRMEQIYPNGETECRVSETAGRVFQEGLSTG